jgi:formylglycine-generating enzyme required for sulfatase activity
MKRPASTIVAAALLVAVAVIVLAGVRAAVRREGGATSPGDAAPCGEGFARRATRCCPTSARSNLPDGACETGPLAAGATCPASLVATPRGCDAPDRAVVRVPATSVLIGPSDWEAEGRVRPRTVKAGPFEIDRFEVTVGGAQCAACPAAVAARLSHLDAARAASHVTLLEARAVCAARGGRLPTEDEWIVAAAGDRPRRYPWGDTGAVCRRAAWGLTRGPCASGAPGPDTVGAHPDGATPPGIHDLAGNVGEWVETDPPCGGGGAGACVGVVRGGSYETDLATELRTWVRREVPASSSEASIGFRCAYDAR